MEPRLLLETTNEPVDLSPMGKLSTYNSTAIIQSLVTWATLDEALAHAKDYKRTYESSTHEETTNLQLSNGNTISSDPSHLEWSLDFH